MVCFQSRELIEQAEKYGTGTADLSKAFIGLRVLFALSPDANFHRHALECVGHSDETAGDGHDLPDVARNGDRDQIEAADTAVRRIEGDPARTWSAQAWVDPAPPVPTTP